MTKELSKQIMKRSKSKSWYFKWSSKANFYRGIIANDSITLEENRVLKNYTKETADVFNNFYINIAEATSGKQPSSIGNPNSQSQDRATVKKIIESNKNQPLVVTIK